ncbi:hypothetical protein ABPG75_002070, partial [Micractinium tetrahymenae]
MAEKMRQTVHVQSGGWKRRPAQFNAIQAEGGVGADEREGDWREEWQLDEEQGAAEDEAGLAVMHTAAQGRGAGRGRPPFSGPPAGGKLGGSAAAETAAAGPL